MVSTPARTDAKLLHRPLHGDARLLLVREHAITAFPDRGRSFSPSHAASPE
jgi:hypothetical protein